MIKRIFWNLYFLTFLNGFLLASLFYFKMEANYERELFGAIRSDVNSNIKADDPQDSVVVKVMHACHGLMTNREPVFEGKSFTGIKSGFLHPTTVDLMTADGACGSFSVVLARLLQGYNFPVRIAQMKAMGKFGAHMIVEVETLHGWVVLDPLFDVYFTRPDHRLASFADVKNNWNYYKQQLPPNYDLKYRYEDVRYSNWTKIPVIFPAVKKMLDLTLGKAEADTISIRTHFLKLYDICFNIMLFFFILIFTLTLKKLIQAKIFPQKNIPFTFSNIFKYLRLRILGSKMPEQGQA
ncbi:MAG: hypothetical protein Q8918_08750 [Bacteroidota bacterium]|nr:hypothetical protein [Bacteroidota bacterium]MDP4212395.1 hypothetical protein [Bacteroidota bacterium]MDP4250181.1 hypothetical protein [Bacteroidota bacterium]